MNNNNGTLVNKTYYSIERGIKLKNKIKILIADDYKAFSEILEKILESYEELQIVGVAYSDKDEIEKINLLKPDVVITDIIRDKKYVGSDIIKHYSNKDNSPYFFIVSSEIYQIDWCKNSKIIGYMMKPFIDYDKIVNIILENF